MKCVTDSVGFLCESQRSADTTRDAISLASRNEGMTLRENESLTDKLEVYERIAVKGGIRPVPGPSVMVASG